MLAFALAVFLLIATPGQGVLSTAGVGSAFGWRPGLSYVSGLWAGTNLVSLAIITGLAAILFSVPIVRTILLFASSGYLGYLALRIALAGSKISFITASKPPGFLSGLFLQFINPKAYAVNTALFTSFAFFPQNIAFELTAKLIIMNIIWLHLHLLWLWAGVKLHSLNLAPKTQKMVNMIMALSLTAVVGLSLYSVLGQNS